MAPSLRAAGDPPSIWASIVIRPDLKYALTKCSTRLARRGDGRAVGAPRLFRPFPRHPKERGIGHASEQAVEPAMTSIKNPTVPPGLDPCTRGSLHSDARPRRTGIHRLPALQPRRAELGAPTHCSRARARVWTLKPSSRGSLGGTSQDRCRCFDPVPVGPPRGGGPSCS